MYPWFLSMVHGKFLKRRSIAIYTAVKHAEKQGTLYTCCNLHVFGKRSSKL